MVDYLKIEVAARVASNPELDPVLKTFKHTMDANRSGGYAAEGDRLIIAASDEIALDFDAFALDAWLEVMIKNDGANACSVTLSDASGDFTIPLPADAQMVLRHYNNSTPGSPKIASTAGTTVEYLAVGAPYTTPT